MFEDGKIINYEYSYWDEFANNWFLSSKTQRVYAGDNYVETESYWDSMSSAWLPSFEKSYSINADSIVTEESYYDGIAGAWIPQSKQVEYFNSQGENSGYLNYFYDFTLEQLVLSYGYKETEFYNDNLLIEIIGTSYDQGIEEFINESKRVFTAWDIAVTPGFEKMLFAKNLKSYPNPCINNIVIETDDFIENDFQFSIYDVNGKLMMQQNALGNSKIIQLDVSTLNHGFYLIQLKNESQFFTSRFVKQ